MSAKKGCAGCLKQPRMSLKPSSNSVRQSMRKGSRASLNNTQNSVAGTRSRLNSRVSMHSTCTQATDGPKRVKLLNSLPSQREEVHIIKQVPLPSLIHRDDKSESPDSVRFNEPGEDTGLEHAVHLKSFQEGTVGEARSFYESSEIGSDTEDSVPGTANSSVSGKRTRSRMDTIHVPESKSQTAGSPRRQTLVVSKTSRRTSERPAIHPLLVASEQTTQVEPKAKANLKQGGCMNVFCKAPKACVTSSKKSIRLCAAPLKKCATVCKPKALVPTPRIGAEWQYAGMRNNVIRTAQHVAEGAKILWFLFSLYILIHIVIGFMTSRDYDPESFYPVKLGFSFWEKKADDGMECLDWFC